MVKIFRFEQLSPKTDKLPDKLSYTCKLLICGFNKKKIITLNYGLSHRNLTF